MKYFYYILFALTIIFTSCKNNDVAEGQADPRLVVPFTQQTASGLQSQSAPVSSQNHNLFHENNAGTKPSIVGGVNPPHGQPNHRCDIAVGAPLNSPVSQSASVQSPQMATSSQNNTVKTVTAKGMNPPHGEKNHRCDIAVGAPLNSKPTTSTVAANSTSTSQQYSVQQPVPALLSTATADAETPAGMNPPHGKEGHRCDIPVGDPLPKS